MDSENTARVLEMPAVKADREAKAAKRAAKEKIEAEAPAIIFGTVTEATSAAVSAYEAEQRAKQNRTNIGKQFADRVKQANEKLTSALSENPKAKASKLHGSLAKSKGRAKEMAAAFEEAAIADKGAVGKAYRSRAKVLEERAEAKGGAASRVEKMAAKFEKVMASISAQAKQLRLDL